jgi:hypothetical protein
MLWGRRVAVQVPAEVRASSLSARGAGRVDRVPEAALPAGAGEAALAVEDAEEAQARAVPAEGEDAGVAPRRASIERHSRTRLRVPETVREMCRNWPRGYAADN